MRGHFSNFLEGSDTEISTSDLRGRGKGRERKERQLKQTDKGVEAQAPWQHIERGRKELPISRRRFTRLSTSATDVELNSELSIAASSFSKTQVTGDKQGGAC